jgi:hypothetical protein
MGFPFFAVSSLSSGNSAEDVLEDMACIVIKALSGKD